MATFHFSIRMAALASTLLLALALSNPAMAHCDSMDGPVVADAQKALAAKDVTPVLKWVRAGDEESIRKAFDMALAVRGESDVARDVADRYFFETLIRIHRASEGEGFTGLKPAGSVAPGIAAADKALVEGNVDRLADDMAAEVRHGIQQRYEQAYRARQVAGQSVAQGRDYVQAYVEFTHFVEAVDGLAKAGASHKHAESMEQAH